MVTQVHPACPFCTRVMPTVEQIQREYGSDIRIAWKQLVVHRDKASTHALAACAAHRQGSFLEMSARLLEDDADDWPALRAHAQELGLDLEAFARDIGDESCVQEVVDGMDHLGELGVRGVPSFFINGRFLGGAQPIDDFRPIIDEELKKARAAMAAGASAADYYQSLVDAGRRQAP
jgi:protein-disulfide isomerase